jgi:multiple sugar transport system permease protein
MTANTDLAPSSAAGAVLVRAATNRGPLWPRISLMLNRLWPYLFLTPFLILFVLFFVAPFIYDVSQSFYAEKHIGGGLGLTPPKVVWVGLDNYKTALTNPDLWDGFRRVLLFGLVQIPVMMGIALIIALLMDSAVIRFRRFFRLAAFAPYAVPGVVAAILWSFFYTPTISPITSAFHAVHLPAPDFLTPSTILWSLGNISTWEYTGYNMLIFFAAMQAIPQELYEASRIDGLSEIGIARYIKIPLILPALRLGLLFSLIGTLQLFNEPHLLSGVSGAITSSFTPNLYAFNVAIFQTNFYLGGAIAAILGVITFAFSYLFMRLTQR